MSGLRVRKGLLLAKIETTEGVDAIPSAGSDAIRIEVSGSPINIDPSVVTPNEVRNSLDSSDPIIGGIKASLNFSTILRGASTAGDAPEIAPLLKACGLGETLTQTAVPASAEALGGTGDTNTAELGASASTTVGAYDGMPIDFSAAVVGSSFITDYQADKTCELTDSLGGTLDPGSDYQIPLNALYTPQSGDIPSLTMYVYVDGLLYKTVGARGTFDLTFNAAEQGTINWNFSGLFVQKIDAPLPAATYNNPPIRVWRDGAMKINRAAAGVQSLSLSLNNNVVYPANPNAEQGFDAPCIVDRNVNGNMNPFQVLVATRDVIADMKAATKRILHLRYGTVPGQRIGLTVSNAQYTGSNPTERDGLSAEDVPFQATGDDSGFHLCFY